MFDSQGPKTSQNCAKSEQTENIKHSKYILEKNAVEILDWSKMYRLKCTWKNDFMRSRNLSWWRYVILFLEIAFHHRGITKAPLTWITRGPWKKEHIVYVAAQCQWTAIKNYLHDTFFIRTTFFGSAWFVFKFSAIFRLKVS